jgi:hypothetical protein
MLAAVSVAVLLETGNKRVFASALDWPGWSRSGRDEDAALDALAAYGGRYEVAARRAELKFPAARGRALAIVERLPGSAGTDFGVPMAIAAAEWEAPTAAQARRLAALLEAAWWALDQAAKGAPPVLRKGPRGGGRDRDAIVWHVISAETAYVRKIGLRLGEPPAGDGDAVAEFRRTVAKAVAQPGSAPPPGPRTKPWPLRYLVRRAAWHALDHAWEIEDRREDA